MDPTKSRKLHEIEIEYKQLFIYSTQVALVDRNVSYEGAPKPGHTFFLVLVVMRNSDHVFLFGRREHLTQVATFRNDDDNEHSITVETLHLACILMTAASNRTWDCSGAR